MEAGSEEDVALLREEVREEEEQAAEKWSDADLRRYLRANEGDSRAALSMLRATMAWRREFKPEQVTAELVSKQIARRTMFVEGRSLAGCPVVYTIKRREVGDSDYALETRFLVYTMREAIKRMEAPVDQWMWVLDLSDYSRDNSPPLSVSKETMHILKNHFPDRLHTIVMINAPWVFKLAFRMLSAMIPARTKAKMHWVNGEKPDLSQWISPEHVHERFK